MNDQPFYPGQIIGIIGGGYAGLRLVMSAKLMGFKVAAYGSNPADEVMQLADFMIMGTMDDRSQLQQFAEECDLVVYVNGYIDAASVDFMNRFTTIPQGSSVLEIIQDRLLERAFFDQINVNIAPYVTVLGLDDVYSSMDSIGYPAVLKPIQRVKADDGLLINKSSDIAKAADFIDAGTFVLESYIPHVREFTLIFSSGRTDKAFPIIEQRLVDGQLVSAKIADINPDILNEMMRIGLETVNNVDFAGNLAIEFYLTNTNALYIKGILPGLFLQGNLFDYATTVDQYTQFLTAVTGSPLKQISVQRIVKMMTFEATQISELKTQWVLKDNWTSFAYPALEQGKIGHILITGDSMDKIEMQIDNTEIWMGKGDS